MVGHAMTITLVCPICDKPLICEKRIDERNAYHFSLECVGSEDGHFYGANASTEEEARAILEKPQKRLVDALSAKIALPIEQRKHAKSRKRVRVLHAALARAEQHFRMLSSDMDQPGSVMAQMAAALKENES
jgi:hypothetical protein